jgi:hypothetical protein
MRVASVSEVLLHGFEIASPLLASPPLARPPASSLIESSVAFSGRSNMGVLHNKENRYE